MTILLITGIMDLHAMVVVAAAGSIEHLAPACESAARAIGVFTAGAGVYLMLRAVGLG